MRYLRIFLILSLIGLFITPSISQMSRKAIKRNNKNMSRYHGNKNSFGKQKQYDYIGASINLMNYFGDIVPKSRFGSTKISFTRPGFSLVYGHRFGPRLSVQGSYSLGRLQSDDFKVANPDGENSKFRYVRNASFRNDIHEIAAVAIVDLFKNEGSYLNRVEFTPYAILGIAVFHHNPKAKVPETYTQTGQAFPEAGQWIALQPLGTEGQNANLASTDVNFGVAPYKLWQIAIPFGLGVRYNLAEAIDISFDISFRYLFTDYIDDVSRNYVDLGVLDSDLAKALSDRTLEPTAAVDGGIRDTSGFSKYTYVGRDGQTYTTVAGYGAEFEDNKRGGSSVNDIYYVTSFRITYILGASFRRAKFR